MQQRQSTTTEMCGEKRLGFSTSEFCLWHTRPETGKRSTSTARRSHSAGTLSDLRRGVERSSQTVRKVTYLLVTTGGPTLIIETTIIRRDSMCVVQSPLLPVQPMRILILEREEATQHCTSCYEVGSEKRSDLRGPMNMRAS